MEVRQVRRSVNDQSHGQSRGRGEALHQDQGLDTGADRETTGGLQRQADRQTM